MESINKKPGGAEKPELYSTENGQYVSKMEAALAEAEKKMENITLILDILKN